MPRYSALKRNPVPLAKLAPPVVRKVNTMLLKAELEGVIKDSPQNPTLPVEGPAVYWSTVTARRPDTVHKQRAQKRRTIRCFISLSAARLFGDG